LLARGGEELDEFVERLDTDLRLLALCRCLRASRGVERLRFGRELRGFIERGAADRGLVCGRSASLFDVFVGFRGPGGAHDDRTADSPHVLVAGRERTELAGGDEVLSDLVMPRIPAGTVLDGDGVRLMFLVLLDV